MKVGVDLDMRAGKGCLEADTVTQVTWSYQEGGGIQEWPARFDSQHRRQF